jgi:hypothetical protein
MFSPCNTLEYLVEWTLKFQQCARLVLGFYKLQTKRVPLTPKTKYQSKSTTFPRPMYHSLAQLYPSPPNTLYVINKNVSRLTRSKLPSLSLHFLPPPHKPLPSTNILLTWLWFINWYSVLWPLICNLLQSVYMC